jgi:hypothetical protein
VWKPIPSQARIEVRRTALTLAAAAAIALTAPAGTAFASCWASNPDGTRTCSEYINHGGSFEYLCEDEPGDCEDLGYTKGARPRHHLPEMRVEPRRSESRSAGENSRRAEAKPRARDSARAYREPDTREAPSVVDRESRDEERRPSHAMPGVEDQVAAGLSLTLAICGLLLLPTADRARFWRLIGRVAWALSLVFLFMIAVVGAGPKKRRRRYY